MDSTIIDIISQFGFPIAAYAAMFIYMKDREEKNDERFDALQKSQTEQMNEITKAVNNNTTAITILTERLTRDEQ